MSEVNLLCPRDAVVSACGTWRWRLDRYVQETGGVFAFFGVNPSKADASMDDHTATKWDGFSLRLGARRWIAGNPFGLRSTEVSELAAAEDPVGPECDRYLAEIIAEADTLIPCWGNRTKVPARLRYRFNDLESMIVKSGKPAYCFGLTSGGDPKHPLTLPYSTPLLPWMPRS